MTDEDTNTLEAFLDNHHISAVLAAIANICGIKAQWAAETWQDMPLAKQWNNLADRIENCSKLSEGL